jgi:hypothetical protein
MMGIPAQLHKPTPAGLCVPNKRESLDAKMCPCRAFPFPLSLYRQAWLRPVWLK